MLYIFGDRDLAIGRELTKAHEILAVRPISLHLSAPLEERGEFTLAVRGAEPRRLDAAEAPAPRDMVAEFGRLTEIVGLARREAIRTLAAKYGISAREVFARLETGKLSGD
jgi:16S rRNA C1402 (ribose-2'-O) methylase RsmI